MSIRSLSHSFVACLALAAVLPQGLPADAAEPIPTSPVGPSSPALPIPPIEIPRIKSALELDVEENPVYSSATKAALIDQILSGFSDFDQVGIAWDAPAPPANFGGTSSQQPIRLVHVALEDPYTGTDRRQDCTFGKPCTLPLDYNVTTPEVRLVWAYRDEAMRNRFLEYVNESNGRALGLEINGRALVRRPVKGLPTRFDDYTATHEIGRECLTPMTLGCLVVVVERDAWFDGPAPWPNWAVRVGGTFTKSGGRFPILEEIAEQLVAPESEVKDFFSATIAKSAMSARCTTCHQIDTPEKIEAQHSGSVAAADVFLADSIVNEDEVINTCVNCHESGLPTDFHERRWATPTPAQDINWGAIINAYNDSWPLEICDRMVGNLPTASARTEHFHEDARLFWAVADGVTPFGDQLPTSHPGDYDQFLDHFDAWNAGGAPCPDMPVPEPGVLGALMAGGAWLAALARRGRDPIDPRRSRTRPGVL